MIENMLKSQCRYKIIRFSLYVIMIYSLHRFQSYRPNIHSEANCLINPFEVAGSSDFGSFVICK